MYHELLRPLIALLIIVVILAGALVGVVYFFPHVLSFNNVAGNEQIRVSRDLITAVQTGDYEDALSTFTTIQNDSQKSDEEKALATFAMLGAEFRLTGDTTARIDDIHKMQTIILDESLSLRTRVNTLNVYLSQYAISGRDPFVFQEMYKNVPFSEYLVPGDPDLSARHLAEWSYEMLPTSSAAITIARWYTEQYINNPSQSPAATNEYAQIAEDYLRKAEVAAEEERREDPQFTRTSTRYLVYQYWRTRIISRLATQIGEPYLSQYKSVSDQFISFASTQNSVLAKEFLLYTRLFYAQRLVQDDEAQLALTQINQLASELEAIQNPDTNVFVLFLRNEFKNNPNGPNWTLVSGMTEVSPAFKRAIDAIL